MHEMSCNRWFLESTCHYNLIRVINESCALVLKIHYKIGETNIFNLFGFAILIEYTFLNFDILMLYM